MRFITFLIALFNLMPAKAVEARDTAYQFSFKSIDGRDLPLKAYEGKVILLVNTASHCGFTSQYKSLQALWETYKQKGLVVIAVPSNDFNQELSNNSKVKEFCNISFDLTLPMTEITSIRGKNAHPFYRWLKKEHNFQPKWNFYKVLLDKSGHFHSSFNSLTKPNSTSILKVVDEILKQP